MIRLRHLVALAAILLIPLTGCSNSPAVTAGIGEPFTLGVGQSAQIAAEGMAVKFNEVIDDSRCPQGVTCIWAGQASSRVTITYQGKDYPMVLTLLGSTDQTKESFAQYTLIYGLSPYPVQGQRISPKDYRLNLTVTK